MPKARGDHLPVNWSFYQSILGQPVVNTFQALQTVGYDAPWELYVRYCDVSGGKFRAVLGAMDAKAEENFRARIKAGFKGSEALYLNDCWKVLMQQRKAEQGVELGEGDKPSVEGFTGGSWRSWNTLRLKGRDDGKIQVKESKRTFQIPANDKSISTLLPPTPDEKNRWFKIYRPPTARRPSQSADQNQNDAVQETEDGVQETEDANADPEDAPGSRRVHRAQLHRTVRLPSLPGTSIGQSRFTFRHVDWSNEDGDTKEVALMFDKDAQELQLIQRKPGAAEGEWELAAQPMNLETLAGLNFVDGLMELAKEQGLLDTERYDKLALLARLRLGVDTLDLATNLARGFSLNTYPMVARGSREARFRLYLDPSSSSSSSTAKNNRSKYGFGVLEQITPTIFPTHAPEHFAARLGMGSRRNLKTEGILARNDPNDPPKLEFTPEGTIEILPYISAVGATQVRNGWEIDVSTPNRNTNPPIVTPPFPDAAQSLPPTSESPPPSPPKPGEAFISRSASPETFRIWSCAINRDMSYLPKVPVDWKGGYYSAWTGEQVREKMPVLWSWAKSKGYWKEIPEKEE